MEKEEIILQEYNALRTEIQESFNSLKKILAIGVGIIGALFTGGIINQTNSTQMSAFGPLSLIAFLILIIPLISLITYAMWLGEYQRIQRAGNYLVGLELKINAVVDAKTAVGEESIPTLYWENYLKNNDLHMRYPYSAIIVLMIIISILSHTIGGYVIVTSNRLGYFALQAVFFILQAGGFWYLIRKYIGVRNKINKAG